MSHPRESLVGMDRLDVMLHLSSRQYGFVAREQARDAGIDRWTLRRLLANGPWEPATPRVLRLVGAPPHKRAPLMLATLDGGQGTAVVRRAAAALWDVPGYPLGPVETGRERGSGGRRPSIGTFFPLRYLPAHHVTTVAGIAVVTLPFLLFQLAGIDRPERVERALHTIITRSPAVLTRLHDLLPELAANGRNGITFMRDFLDRNPPGTRVVASGLEGRFERILREGGERPLTRQVDAGGHEWIGRVDFVDRDLAALFEVDSVVHHCSELDAAADDQRDRDLLMAGWRSVTRIPEEWIWHEPHRAVEAVREVRRRLRRELRPFDTPNGADPAPILVSKPFGGTGA